MRPFEAAGSQVHRRVGLRTVSALLGMAMTVLALAGCEDRPPPEEVTLYGDSLSVEAGLDIDAAALAQGLVISQRTRVATAPCDWFEQMQKDAAAPKPPRVVVLAFTGNSIFACMNGDDERPVAGRAIIDRYAADLAKINDIWEPMGVAVSVLGAPAMADDDRADFNAMLQERSAAFGWHYHDTTVDLSPGQQFVDVLPCAPYESVEDGTCEGPVIDDVPMNVVRNPDGVHLCPNGRIGIDAGCSVYASGAVRWAHHVVDAALVGRSTLGLPDRVSTPDDEPSGSGEAPSDEARAEELP